MIQHIDLIAATINTESENIGQLEIEAVKALLVSVGQHSLADGISEALTELIERRESEQVDDLQAQIEDLQADIGQLQDDNRDLESDRDAAQDECSDLRNELEQFRSDVRDDLRAVAKQFDKWLGSLDTVIVDPSEDDTKTASILTDEKEADLRDIFHKTLSQWE